MHIGRSLLLKFVYKLVFLLKFLCDVISDFFIISGIFIIFLYHINNIDTYLTNNIKKLHIDLFNHNLNNIFLV